MRKLSIGARQRHGLRYVTDDRLDEGIVGSLSVAINMVTKRIGMPPFWVHGRTRPADDRRATPTELVDEYNIMTPSIHTHAGSLSGGNIQKVVLARELSFDPKVVVFNKPTYGLDVKTATAVAYPHPRAGGQRAPPAPWSSPPTSRSCWCSATASRCCRAVASWGSSRTSPGAEQEIGALMIGGEPR